MSVPIAAVQNQNFRFFVLSMNRLTADGFHLLFVRLALSGMICSILLINRSEVFITGKHSNESWGHCFWSTLYTLFRDASSAQRMTNKLYTLIFYSPLHVRSTTTVRSCVKATYCLMLLTYIIVFCHDDDLWSHPITGQHVALIWPSILHCSF